MDLNTLKNEVATVSAECGHIEFKDRFVAEERRAWCEITKDVLALANSGGGCIVFGLNSDGSDSGINPTGFENIDPATITDKISAYLSRRFTEFRVEKFERNGRSYPGVVVDGVPIPLVPKHNGNYPIGGNRSESAFYQGAVYFRHQAKSELAEQADIDRVVRLAEERARVKFAAEMQNVARLPEGFTVQAVPASIQVSLPKPTDRFRITDDPTAPECVVVDKYRTHPHRQKDVIAQLSKRIQNCRANAHDILCVRKVHASEIERGDLIYMPPHSSTHYADGFVDWIAGKLSDDATFLEKARSAYKALAGS